MSGETQSSAKPIIRHQCKFYTISARPPLLFSIDGRAEASVFCTSSPRIKVRCDELLALSTLWRAVTFDLNIVECSVS